MCYFLRYNPTLVWIGGLTFSNKVKASMLEDRIIKKYTYNDCDRGKENENVKRRCFWCKKVSALFLESFKMLVMKVISTQTQTKHIGKSIFSFFPFSHSDAIIIFREKKTNKIKTKFYVIFIKLHLLYSYTPLLGRI